MVVDAPVVVRRLVPQMVQTVQKTVEVPQLQFPWVWSSWTRLQCFDKVVDVLVVLVQTVQPVEKIPQVQFLDAGHR